MNNWQTTSLITETVTGKIWKKKNITKVQYQKSLWTSVFFFLLSREHLGLITEIFEAKLYDALVRPRVMTERRLNKWGDVPFIYSATSCL